MSLINYLPTNSEYSLKLATALKPFEDSLYVVGSAARKFLYGINTTPKDYNLVYNSNVFDTSDGVVDALETAFPNKVQLDDENGYIFVDCEVFTLSIYVGLIDTFLRTVRFAGDGLAVYVPDGRPIMIPEFMTLPPIVQIIKIKDSDAQNRKEWVSDHLVALTKFQDELFNEVNKAIDKSNVPQEVAGS